MATKRKRTKQTKRPKQKNNNTTIIVAQEKKSGSHIAKMLWRIIYISVLCCLAIGLISWGLNKIGTLFDWWNVATVTVDATEDGFATNTNGGLTYDQIQQELEDADSPFCDDQYSQFQIVEYPAYVVFYRAVATGSGSYVYPNIIFAKTENGLVWDGVSGVTATISTNWWTGEHHYDSLNITLNLSTVAPTDNTFLRNYITPIVTNPLGLPLSFLAGTSSNQVLFSNFSSGFCQYFDSFNPVVKIWYNWNNENNTLCNYVRPYLIQNVVAQYFSNWGNGIELLSGDYNTATTTADADYFTKFNSYFSFLYDQLKTDDHTNNSKLVDSSDYYARFLSDEEAESYPIPSGKLVDYDGETYYKVYKCKILAECTYTYVATNSTSTVPAVSKLDDYTIEAPAVVEEQAKLTVKLVNSDESNLTGLSLADYPVTIIIDGRKFVYDDATDLANGKIIALDKGDTYTYSIISEALEFTSYSGTVSVLNSSQSVSLNYTYSGLYITEGLSLNLLNSTPDDFNLSNYPITITFTGTANEGTYTTTWNSNSVILSTNNVIMKRGTYVFVVSSDYITFNSTSGQITVDNSNKYYTFSCYFPNADLVQWEGYVDVFNGSGTTLYVSFDAGAIGGIYDALELDMNEYFDLIIKVWDNDDNQYASYSTTITVPPGDCSFDVGRTFAGTYYPESFIQFSFYSLANQKLIVMDMFTVTNNYNDGNGYNIFIHSNN